MRKTLNDEVNIIAYYSAKKRLFVPYSMNWQNKDYVFEIGEGLYHKFKEGDAFIHIFETVNKEHKFAFRLRFNAKSLAWTLEAISDGLPA
jgi:hypothetical protein